MREISPRLNRGTSVIAAIALAAIIGVIVLGFNALQGASTNSAAQGAQAAAPAGAAAPSGIQEQCQVGYQYVVQTQGATVNAKPTPISGCKKDATGAMVPGQGIAKYAGKSLAVSCAQNGVIFTIVNGRPQANLCPTPQGGAPGAGAPAGSGAPDASPAVTSDPNLQTGGACTINSNPPQTGVWENGECNASGNPTGSAYPDYCQVNGLGCVQGSPCSTTAGVQGVWDSGECNAGGPTILQGSCPSGQSIDPNTGLCVMAPVPAPAPAPTNVDGSPTYSLPSSAGAGSNVQCWNNDNGTQDCYPANQQDFNSLQAQGYQCTAEQGGNDAVCTKAATLAPTVCDGSISASASCTQQCTNGATNPPYCNNNSCGQTCPPGSVPAANCSCVPNNQQCPQGYQGTPPNNCYPQQQQTQPRQQTSSTGGSPSPSPTFGSPASSPANSNSCSGLASIFGGCSTQSTVSCQMTASPNPVQQGMPATLQWTTSGNVYSAQISNVGAVPLPSGSYTIYPTASTNYSMTVIDQYNNQNTCNASVNVTPRTGTGTGSGVTPQTPYGTGTNGQACGAPPQQPAASSCTVGTLQPVSATGNGCITSYQCVPNGSTATTATPVPQISCQPPVADVGAAVAISYSCANSTDSTGNGFSTNDQTSGTVAAVIARPPAGSNTATYGITCANNQNGTTQTASAQCSIQINSPAIVLVGNPSSIASGDDSSIGWVTAGMQSCVASSPTDHAFTQANATDLGINGIATTSALTANTEYDLTCQTIGGSTFMASTSVMVK